VLYEEKGLRCPKALGATESLDEAAELLMKSKTNVRMVISKLEVDLGRHLDLPTIPGPAAAEEGKLLLIRLPKRSRSQLTAAGAALFMSSTLAQHGDACCAFAAVASQSIGVQCVSQTVLDGAAVVHLCCCG
jgi:hypothetical protein